MRVAVYQGADKPLSIEERPRPKAGPGELVLRVTACGICGSDIHAAKTGYVPVGTVMGHEFSGEVTEVGVGVEGWMIGDQAIGVPMRNCGDCENCRNNKPIDCAEAQYIGLQGDVLGAYAEYINVQAANTINIGDSISTDMAALWEPLAVALKAFNRANVVPEDSILIVGGGPIGLSLALIAKSLGVNFVGLSEMQPERLERGTQCGANVIIDAGKEKDPVAAFTRQTGTVPRVIFECVGLPGLFQNMIDIAPPGAHLVIVGACMIPEEFSVVGACFKQLTCSFSVAYEAEEIAYVLEAMATGAIDPTPLMTTRTNFQELPQTFEGLKQPNAECKVLLIPD